MNTIFLLWTIFWLLSAKRLFLTILMVLKVQEWQKVKVEWNMKVASLMNNLFH